MDRYYDAKPGQITVLFGKRDAGVSTYEGGGHMTLEDLAKLMNKGIEVRFTPYKEAGARWYAHLEHAEIKDGAILSGASGWGDTPMEALENYCKTIAGKTLVFDAYRETRTVIQVPQDMTVAALAVST